MAVRTSIRRGQSLAHAPLAAAREFHQAVAQPGMALAVFFCSTAYDLEILGAEIAALFGDAHVIGCTTAGELGPTGYVDGSITGFSIGDEDCCAVSELIRGISAFQMAAGHAATEAAMEGFARRNGAAVDPANTFAMLLTDGMCAHEEALLASIHARMHNIPLFGGSAGDDYRLKDTFVYHQGRFHRDVALLTLVRLRQPFKLYRCQHFAGSDVKMVVTQADPAGRTVGEINAEPAAAEYARIVGLEQSALTPMLFAQFPLMVRVGGDYYVRSIQRMNDDGSLTFFCAIDEGVVLTLGRRENILDNLDAFFGRVRREMGAPQLVIGFDCILRSVEAEHQQTKHLMGRILAANQVVGFCTYGEQFGAMHVNQTFTALVIGGAEAA